MCGDECGDPAGLLSAMLMSSEQATQSVQQGWLQGAEFTIVPSMPLQPPTEHP